MTNLKVWWDRLFLHILIICFVLCLSSSSSVAQSFGHFEVTSVPEGGDVFIDSRFYGETPVLIPIRNQTPGTSIKVMMQGFKVWEQSIAGTPQPGQIVPIKAVLIPVSPFGTLEVTSTPTGALVTIDNGNGQMTPWTYRDITSGTRLVSLFMSGFDPYITNVDVLPGTVTRLHANMRVRTAVGSLQVSSTPGGAAVYVNGVFSGTTNTVVGNIPPGNHQVRISKAGFADSEEWIIVQPNQVTILDKKLETATKESGGALVITADLPGASVYLNNQFMGTTQTGRPLELTGLTPGTYEVYISIRNYEDYKTTVQVGSGDVIPVSAHLNPSPMPCDMGKLMINTEPSGAEIFVDAVFVGVTPATIDDVSSGPHQYRLVLMGYNEYESEFELIPGQSLQINTNLVKTPAPSEETPAPAALVIFLVLGSVALLFSRRR